MSITAPLPKVNAAPRAELNPRRHPIKTARQLWRQSLQFRAVSAAGILMMIAFIFVGSFLTHQIANSLFDGRLNQALEESKSGFTNVQSLLDSSDATANSEIERDVLRFMTVLEVDGSESSRQWILVPHGDRDNPGSITAHSQDPSITADAVPAELDEAVREDDGGIYWQSSSITQNGVTHPVLFVGTSIKIQQNPDYGLYLVYDLSASQQTMRYINLVILLAFLILLVVVLSIVWFVTRTVIRPIASTAITAEKLAAGDLDRRVIVRGENETSRLGHSFNRMADGLQNQISQLETLSSMQQQFVSDVSHELRTPLTTVRMAAEMLYNGREDLNPAYRRPTELLYHQVDRFDSLLADLLEISRFDAGSATLDCAPVDLLAVINDVLLEVQPHLARTGTELALHTDERQIMVEMDHRRIERVLRNLLFNAVEHSEGNPIDVYIGVNENTVGLAVRDHGIGMKPEHLDQVFNRFWRADPSRKRTLGGTGLGLSIAAEDVRLHQGTLEAWGKPGEGACFRMTLPLTQDIPMGSSPVLLTGEPENGSLRSTEQTGATGSILTVASLDHELDKPEPNSRYTAASSEEVPDEN